LASAERFGFAFFFTTAGWRRTGRCSSVSSSSSGVTPFTRPRKWSLDRHLAVGQQLAQAVDDETLV